MTDAETTNAVAATTTGHAEGTSLYVGNLPYSARWQDLKEHFKEAGEVAFADIPRGSDNRSRGYGIVRYETAAEAQAAVEMFNETEFNGRKMVVRMDNRGADRPPRQPRQPRVPAADAAPGEVKATNDGSFPLFVGNLPWSTSWQDLKDLAKAQGLNPTRADVTMGHDGKSRGWGTLAFATLEEAHKAIEVLNGHELEGRQMEVREDRKRQ